MSYEASTIPVTGFALNKSGLLEPNAHEYHKLVPSNAIPTPTPDAHGVLKDTLPTKLPRANGLNSSGFSCSSHSSSTTFFGSPISLVNVGAVLSTKTHCEFRYS